MVINLRISDKGFSLIELMAVMAILALAMGLVLAGFSSTGSRLESEATRMATLIRTLDDMASARKASLEMGFDFKEGTISWSDTSGSNQSREMGLLVSVEALSLGVVNEGQLKLIFDPSVTTESMYLHFEDDGERISVLYSPLVRRVKLIGPEKIS